MAKNNNGQGDSISRSLQRVRYQNNSWIQWYMKGWLLPPASLICLGLSLCHNCSCIFGSENHALNPSLQRLSPLNLLEFQVSTPGLLTFYKEGSLLLFSPFKTQVKKRKDLKVQRGLFEDRECPSEILVRIKGQLRPAVTHRGRLTPPWTGRTGGPRAGWGHWQGRGRQQPQI